MNIISPLHDAVLPKMEWPMVPLKHLLSANDGGAWGSDPLSHEDPIVLRSTEQRVDGTWNIVDPARRRLEPSEFLKTRLIAGDIVVTKSSGSADHIGKASLVTRDIEALGASYSNFMQRLRTLPVLDPRYLTLMMNNKFVRDQMAFLSSSSTGLANISAAVIGRVRVPFPPLAVQAKILGFLNREAAEIDFLISKKEDFIGLLVEKANAIIANAVTKGIVADAETRNSSIGWIGIVPSHWSTVRIAALFKEVDRPADIGLPVLSVSIHGGVTDKQLSDEDRDRAVNLSEDRTKYQRVKAGDLVYNMMRAWQGAFGTVTVDGLVSPAYVVAEATTELRTKFVELLLRTASGAVEVRRYSKGIADFRMRLYWEHFRNLKICLPPLTEQDDILNRVAHETSRISRLIAKIERSIELLKERRSALITAAITGKIDVRIAA